MRPHVPETRWAVILTVAFVCAGCAASANIGAGYDSVGHTTPEAAVSAFVTGWNAGDFDAVASSFDPRRREMLVAQRDEVEAQIAGWRLENAAVDTLCHPRGGGWKTVRFTRVRNGVGEAGEPGTDAAWLRLRDGAWWMYSL